MHEVVLSHNVLTHSLSSGWLQSHVPRGSPGVVGQYPILAPASTGGQVGGGCVAHGRKNRKKKPMSPLRVTYLNHLPNELTTQIFEYTSGATRTNPGGSISGSFQMVTATRTTANHRLRQHAHLQVTEDKEEFDVYVGPVDFVA